MAREEQALCQILASNISINTRNDTDKIKHFRNNDLELPQLTLGQGHDTPLRHKQYLCEVRTSNVNVSL